MKDPMHPSLKRSLARNWPLDLKEVQRRLFLSRLNKPLPPTIADFSKADLVEATRIAHDQLAFLLEAQGLITIDKNGHFQAVRPVPEAPAPLPPLEPRPEPPLSEPPPASQKPLWRRLLGL